MEKTNNDESLVEIEEQIKKLNEMINARYARLVKDVENLEQEKGKFDSAHQVLVKFKDPIKINVGGKIFMTSKSTLMKEDSMLRAMFSGRHELEKGEDGAYFIDRDPKYFGKILNYLRDGEFELRDDEVERREFMREAEFYCLPSLLKKFETRIAFERKGPGVVLKDATASYTSTGCGADYQSAFTRSFSKGVHSCVIKWTGSDMLIGVTGDSVRSGSLKGAYTQPGAMMLYGLNTSLYVNDARVKTLVGFKSDDVVEMTLDCDKRTVTWRVGTSEATEPMHGDMTGPFSFCVDLHSSSATICSLK